MRDATPEYDAAALESYLSAALDDEVVDTEVVHEALNLSVVVSTAADEEAFVVRRPDKLKHTDLFNDLREEYRTLERLEAAALPTPEPVHFCEDASVLGDEFFVMSHLDGEATPLGSALPERFQNPDSRARVGELLVDTLADVHVLDAERFADVCTRRTPLEQVEHASERLDAATAVAGREFPRLRAVGEWLRENAPDETRTALVHGDFRPGNLLFAAAPRPEISGVLDWETAMLGDPRTELGYLLLRWRDDGDPTPPLDDIEARYDDGDALQYLRGANEDGLAPFTNEPGSPSRRELVARYEDRTGIPYDDDRFYRAHAAFMLATVWADIHRHQLEAGGESDREPLVEYVALVAQQVIDGDHRL